MKLEIITPETTLFEGTAKALQVPGVDGLIGILDNHAPLISTLKAGKIKITDTNGTDSLFPINGGVVEVLNNKVIVLAD
ncbi:MAG TPA: ATP synthase F1 subunit epsilon [Luteibaculaceae bacterium]|nr:ATP synthase F1 subunit epsilon [Luteibaculaceae bacterium]